MSEAVSKWYRQLPEDHWIKENENNLFDTDFFTYQIMNIYQTCIGTSKTSLQLFNLTLQQYVDDASIAQIYAGKITGISKGKTILHLFCNGYNFKHNIKVEE